MTARTRALTVALLAGVVAISSALAGSWGSSPTGTSSLDRKTVLPARIHWTRGSEHRRSQASCGVDPLHTWKVGGAAGDKSMRLDPVGTDPCGDRVAVMQGTRTRVP